MKERDTAATPDRDVFVGRTHELRVLRDALERALAGIGSVMTLAGEAGIGKTRTSEELARHARRSGASVLRGACYEGEWTPPYGPLVEAFTAYVRAAEPKALREDLGFGAAAIASVVPAIRERFPDTPRAEPLQPDEARLRLFDALGQLVRALAERHPLVLILDDLHWAEAGSLALLRYLARFVTEQRLLILLAYREAELEETHPLHDLLGSLRRESRHARVALKSFTDAEGADLVLRVAARSVPDPLVTAIHRRAQGNPFFIREIVHHLLEEGTLESEKLDLSVMGVPEGIRHIVGRRLSRLSAPARELLTVASAFTRPFRLDVATAAAGLDMSRALEAIDEALRARLLEPAPHADSYAFEHALVQRTLYEALSPSRRARLHRELAAALLRVCGSRAGEHSGEVALQYHRSRDLGGAEGGAEHALAAADRGAAASAYEDVATMLRIALDLLPENDPRRPRILGRRAIALTWALDFDRNLAACLEAADAVAAAEGAGAAADYLAEAIVAMEEVGDYTSSARLAREGLDLIGDRRDAAWALLRSIDLIHSEMKDPAHPGIAVDTPERREIWNVLTEVYRRGGAGPATDGMMLDRASIMLDTHGSAVGPLMAAGEARAQAFREGRLRASFSTGQYREGTAIWSRIAETTERAGRLSRAVAAWSTVARFHTALGEFPEARAAHERALSLARRLTRRTLERAQVAAAEDEWRMAHDTDWDRPLATASFDLDGGDSGTFVLYRASTIASVARIHARMGRTEKALRRVASVLPAIERAAVWAENYVRLCCDAAEALWLVRSDEHAAAIERNVREKIVANDYHYPMCDARLALARLSALGKRHDEAAEWFDRARTVLDSQGARPLRAIADHDEALMYVRRGQRGDRERAQRLLETAVARFREIGMPGWTRRAEILLLEGREANASEWSPARASTTPPESAGTRGTQKHEWRNVFRREGEIWAIAYAGRSIQLRPHRGLGFLAVLLANPGAEVHALTLVNADRAAVSQPPRDPRDAHAPQAPARGDAGPLLDAAAVRQYRSRLRDLQDELDEASANADIGRTERLRAEIEILTRELRRAIGLGGRLRQAGSPSERARINVTRALREAVERIARHHPALGEHLRETIRTGTTCSYRSGTRSGHSWET